MDAASKKVIRSDGTVVLLIRGGWTPGVLKDIRDEKFDRLVIGGGKWADFRPLVPFSSKITGLSVSSTVGSFAGLDDLTNLVTLELDDVSSHPVVWSKLKKLRTCYIKWHAKYPTEFFSLPLRNLTLVDFSASNCDSLGSAGKLQELDLRGGRIKSLSGLDRLTSLRRLSLGDLKALSDIESLRSLTKLEALTIENCPRITEKVLGNLASLQT